MMDQLCLDAVPQFLNLFDFSVAPNLLFYSYIPIVIIVLFLGLYILIKDNFSLRSILLLTTGLSFSIWIFNMIFQWTGVNGVLMHFSWEITAIIEIFIPISLVYFFHVFINNGKDISFLPKVLLLFVILPVIILLPTNLNMTSFDMVSCASFVGVLLYYVYGFEIMSALWIVFFGLKKYFLSRKHNEVIDSSSLKQLLFITIGSACFLLIFSISNFLGEVTKFYQINLIGPIGMVIFTGFIAYIIVRFKAFDIKLIGTQALVITLVVLIGSQFFYIRTITNKILTGITLIVTGIIGVNLIRSVKKEVSLRESLQVAVSGQSSLIHFMNHQIKGRFGNIKNIFAELLTDDYGAMPEATHPLLQKGLDESNVGVAYVSGILRGASAESGTLQYEMKSMDFSFVVKDVYEKMKENAEKKNLKMELKIEEGDYLMVGDKTQLWEAVKNLVDNAINYTLEGSILINLAKTNKTFSLKIKDTGVGIIPEDKIKLFKAGGRGANALKVNVNATGYGLVFVKNVVLAHKGSVWAESEGENKGSTFRIEIPR